MNKANKTLIETADVLIIVGILLCSVGIWQIFRPATFIFAGACSLATGIIGLRR